MRDERQRQNFLEYNHQHDPHSGEFTSTGPGSGREHMTSAGLGTKMVRHSVDPAIHMQDSAGNFYLADEGANASNTTHVVVRQATSHGYLASTQPRLMARTDLHKVGIPDRSDTKVKIRDLVKTMGIGDVLTLKRREHGHRRPRSSNYDYIGMERAK